MTSQAHVFLQPGDPGLDDRIDATDPIAAVRIAPGNGIAHPEQRMLMWRDMPVLHLRRSNAADRVRDQSAIGALKRLVSFDDQLRHTLADGPLSKCAKRQRPSLLVRSLFHDPNGHAHI